MALSVASFVSDTDLGANPATVSASWSTGDTIVVAGFMGDDSQNLNAPTATGLTFTAQSVLDGASTGEAACGLWTATAGSAGSGVTVSIATSGGFIPILGVWVISGTVAQVVPITGSTVEAAFTQSVAAGSLVLVAFALTGGVPTRTATTGSGTATERIDAGQAGDIGAWAAEWVGTSAGSFSFGVTDYSTLAVAQVGLVLEPVTITAWDQTRFRWGLDNGTESGHGFDAAENTGITQPATTVRLLRLQVDETLGEVTSSPVLVLQYKRTDDPVAEWRPLTT